MGGVLGGGVWGLGSLHVLPVFVMFSMGAPKVDMHHVGGELAHWCE